jgi:hypothetical protein
MQVGAVSIIGLLGILHGILKVPEHIALRALVKRELVDVDILA